ncbi:SH3 domain-containing protein [Noviherbaspirillum sp. CPCC 100848]|uniref:SH3 domain-containing protein n=1 Tax=Noviherbaspirillum album TaxID=3080276 RepID=A0ABU6JGE3_9BURK|nr:SH3 domain-containing protein [Noviherbaspirillum sp. CPCC 100848]MEC4722608.1 SH3 domain-containing protein [Noviherbaspirillum sp. CPCC 100848]
MKSARLFLSCAALLCATAAAQAIEYKSIGPAPAILYDAPSLKGRKVFVAPRGMPVEVVLTYGEWVKVRDSAGDLSWVEAKMLVVRRNVLVKTGGTRVRESAADAAPVTFTADKGVLLELLETAPAGWLKVRHRDGQSGFVKAAEVWGG